MNSIRNKLSDLFSIIDSNVEIVTIAETKLDSSFPSAQFIVDGHSAPYRKDRNANDGGLLVYIKEGIPSCELKNHPPMSNSFDVIVIEINFRKSNWLLINAYKPPSVNNSLFCDQISRLLDFYSPTYKNIVLMGYFNMRVTDNNFQVFYESHDLHNLIKEKTCFKSTEGTCIDLILTNQKYSFKNSCTIETGVSDFHRMVLTQFKITFQKLPPRTISYRVFTNFVRSDFERDLFLALLSNPFVSHNYGKFLSTFEKILDKHAPIKRRKIRGNQKPFMNKPLRQAIMRISKLLNIFQKTKLSAD